MLSPDYLAHVSYDIVALYETLNTSIVNDIALRIVRMDFVSESSVFQAELLQQSGLVFDDVIRNVTAITGRSEAELRRAFEEAGTQSLAYDDRVYRSAGLNPIPIKQLPALLGTLKAGLRKTGRDLRNMTMTTAVTSQQAYIQAANLAYMQVSSGAMSYTEAVKRAVAGAAQDGASVLYPSGHRDKLDVAVRRATLTGVNQTAATMQLTRADEMGCDLVETTAHMGARLSHAAWQGRVFSRSGRHPIYPDFASSTGYGEGAGLCGWNCRHNFFPYFEGFSSPGYTPEQLDDINSRTVTCDGEDVPLYDATQMQRQMERDIRATKRELSASDAAIKASDDPAARAAMQEQFNHAAIKLKGQEAKLKDFTHQTRLVRQNEREQVLGFGRSPAQKAVWVEKKALQKAGYSDILSGVSGTPHTITDESISRIPNVRSSVMSSGQSAKIRQAHRDLLEFVRHDPPGTEAASYYDMEMNLLARYKGDPASGAVPSKQFDIPHLAMHNHPSGAPPSMTDFRKFLQNHCTVALDVVGNNGCVYTLEKIDGFDGAGAVHAYIRALETLPDASLDLKAHLSFVDNFLLSLKGFGIIYRRG